MITADQARAELAKRELIRRGKLSSNPINENPSAYQASDFESGGLPGLASGRGMNAVKRGATWGDVPGIVASGISGFYGNAPERIAQRPMAFGRSGIFGIAPGVPEEKNQLPYPRPVTGEGKKVAGEMSTLGSVAQLASSTADIVPTGKNIGKFVSRKFGNSKKAQDLSTQLFGDIEEARKTAGAMQGGYIDTNAEENVNLERLKEIISQLPKALQDEIAQNPELIKKIPITKESRQFVIPQGSESKLTRPVLMKGVKPYLAEDFPNVAIDQTKITGNPEIYGRAIEETIKGNPEISPTLKNAETIRAIIKGKVPSKYFNIKLLDESARNAAELGYQNIGQLMTEGRPELAEAMSHYAETMQAGKQLSPSLMTKQGFTKTKPVLKMFGKNSEGANEQAVSLLAEQNPDILKTVEEIRKLRSSTERSKAIGNLVKRFGIGAEYAGGGGLLYGLGRKLFGHG